MENFDIDEMLALEEAQKFDDEYADDFEALNDIEHGKLRKLANLPHFNKVHAYIIIKFYFNLKIK